MHEISCTRLFAMTDISLNYTVEGGEQPLSAWAKSNPCRKCSHDEDEDHHPNQPVIVLVAWMNWWGGGRWCQLEWWNGVGWVEWCIQLRWC